MKILIVGSGPSGYQFKRLKEEGLEENFKKSYLLVVRRGGEMAATKDLRSFSRK